MHKQLSSLSTLIAMLVIAGCAQYRPHDGQEPHGYYEKRDDAGRMKVIYETWRTASEEKVCLLAMRRAIDLGFTESSVIDKQWEQETLIVDNASQGITIRSAGTSSWSSHQGTTTLETGGYIDQRTTRRCTLTMDSAAPTL
jgi:hypothetical protein